MREIIVEPVTEHIRNVIPLLKYDADAVYCATIWLDGHVVGVLPFIGKSDMKFEEYITNVEVLCKVSGDKLVGVLYEPDDVQRDDLVVFRRNSHVTHFTMQTVANMQALWESSDKANTREYVMAALAAAQSHLQGMTSAVARVAWAAACDMIQCELARLELSSDSDVITPPETST